MLLYFCDFLLVYSVPPLLPRSCSWNYKSVYLKVSCAKKSNLQLVELLFEFLGAIMLVFYNSTGFDKH